MKCQKLGFYHLNEIGIATKKRTKAQSRIILLVHLAKILPKVRKALTLFLIFKIIANNVKKCKEFHGKKSLS